MIFFEVISNRTMSSRDDYHLHLGFIYNCLMLDFNAAKF